MKQTLRLAGIAGAMVLAGCSVPPPEHPVAGLVAFVVIFAFGYAHFIWHWGDHLDLPAGYTVDWGITGSCVSVYDNGAKQVASVIQFGGWRVHCYPHHETYATRQAALDAISRIFAQRATVAR